MLDDWTNLCWDCYEKNEDYYLNRWRNDEGGHGINCTGTKCDVCGEVIKQEKKKGWKFW